MKFVNHHQGCCGYVPTHPDGSEWAHVLVLDEGAVVHADTARECLEELVDGYDRCADDDARLAARVRHALGVAEQVQEARIHAARQAGHLPARPDDDTDDDLAVLGLLRAPKASALLLAEPGRPDEQAPWVGPTLVAVTTSYAPTTDVPPLVGDVVWLDPADEEGYLRSLQEVGARSYWAAGAR